MSIEQRFAGASRRKILLWPLWEIKSRTTAFQRAHEMILKMESVGEADRVSVCWASWERQETISLEAQGTCSKIHTHRSLFPATDNHSGTYGEAYKDWEAVSSDLSSHRNRTGTRRLGPEIHSHWQSSVKPAARWAASTGSTQDLISVWFRGVQENAKVN